MGGRRETQASSIRHPTALSVCHGCVDPCTLGAPEETHHSCLSPSTLPLYSSNNYPPIMQMAEALSCITVLGGHQRPPNSAFPHVPETASPFLKISLSSSHHRRLGSCDNGQSSCPLEVRLTYICTLKHFLSPLTSCHHLKSLELLKPMSCSGPDSPSVLFSA